MSDKLDLIVQKSDKILEIARNKQKNFIFGKGWVGTRLLETFEALDITVDGFVVSRKDGSETFRGIPVYGIKELQDAFLNDNIFVALRNQERELSDQLKNHFKLLYPVTYPEDLAVITARNYMELLCTYTSLTEPVIEISGYRMMNPFYKEYDYLLSWVYEAGDLIWPELFGDYSKLDEGPYEYGRVKLDKGDIVLDCGANIGLFSTIAAQKECMVFAFEPVPETARYLEELADKISDRVQACRSALSDQTGQTVFYVQNDDLLGASMYAADNMKHREYTVDMDTVDHFAEQNNLPRVDFIKADIEGAERNMLLGARETIKKYKPKISICTYHLEDDKEVLEDIIRGMDEHYIIQHRWKKLYAYCDNADSQ